MTTVYEGQHTGEFIVSEANGTQSRDTVTIASGEVLKPGHVLGRTKVATALGAAASGNTGNGAISAVTAGGAVKDGIYLAVCVEPGSNGGIFEVEGPDGIVVGFATVGTPFNTEIGFTITDGSADFIAGDRFAITVTTTLDKYKAYNPANSDGSQTAYGVLYAAVDASGGDTDGVALLRDAEINAGEIIWFAGATDLQKAAGLRQLRRQGILAR